MRMRKKVYSPVRVILVGTLAIAGSLYVYTGGYWMGFIFGAFLGEGSSSSGWLAPLIGRVFGGFFLVLAACVAVWALFKKKRNATQRAHPGNTCSSNNEAPPSGRNGP
jgi:hypothetical protein